MPIAVHTVEAPGHLFDWKLTQDYFYQDDRFVGQCRSRARFSRERIDTRNTSSWKAPKSLFDLTFDSCERGLFTCVGLMELSVET